MSVYGRAHDHGIPAQGGLAQPADDDWDTDPDYVNDLSEKAQRWGSKEIIPKEVEQQTPKDMQQLYKKVVEQDNEVVSSEYQNKKSLYGGQ